MISCNDLIIPKVRARQILTLARFTQSAKHAKKSFVNNNNYISETLQSLQLCERYRVPLDLSIPNFGCESAALVLFASSKAESGPTHFLV